MIAGLLSLPAAALTGVLAERMRERKLANPGRGALLGRLEPIPR